MGWVTFMSLLYMVNNNPTPMSRMVTRIAEKQILSFMHWNQPASAQTNLDSLRLESESLRDDRLVGGAVM